MRFTLPISAVAALLMLASTSAQAADELALYIFRDNVPAENLQVSLDGGPEKTVGEDGGVYFDLTAGAHSVTIRDNGNTLHVFRFDSAASQYVDISVSLLGLEQPRVRIEPHFKNESASTRAAAATGTILGRVTSGGEAVPDAQISVNKTGTTTNTDPDGNYRLVLPRGIYNFTIDSQEFGSQTVTDLRVVANVERGASFTISPPDELGASVDATVEEIFAVAKYNPVALGENERYSQGVVDTLGIGELSRFGDSEVSGAVVRVPSVTVVDDRFIFIRGLGGRYITTTLNGATLPSTDPNKRTVPLDLFPTNFVRQLDIKKTFIASMPGESTGGNLQINTRTFPAEGGGQFNFSTGYTSNLTFEDVAADPIRSSTDWLSYDDGDREDNSPLRAISDTLEFGDFLPPGAEQELRRVGGILLKDDWDVRIRTANPLAKLGASYGDVYDVEWKDAEVGFFVAGNYKNEWNQRYSGLERTYNNAGEVEDDFDFQEVSNDVDLNGLVSLGMTVGNSSYTSNTTYSHVSQSRTKVKNGDDGDSGLRSKRSTIEWVEREFISQQFTGNHILGEDEDWILDWQGTISRAERDAPNRRDVRFDLQGDDGIFNLQVPELSKRYDDLADDNLDLSANFDYLFDISDDISATLSFGGGYINRDRDSDSETYGYFGGNTLDDSAPNLEVNDVVDVDTITGDPATGYAFLDKTQPSDSYEADLDLWAGYASLDTLINYEHQVIVGARYEDFDQTTDTFTTQGDQGPVKSRIDEQEILPTLAYNWLFAEEQQLRFALTKTVSRPDFKESSNAVFFDPEFDIGRNVA